VDLALGQVLYESGNAMNHVYFPTTAVVALLYAMENGNSAEIAVVGNEGVVGVSLFMGGASTSSRAVVQCAGKGFRLSADLMMEEFRRGGPVLHLLLRYTQALLTQMSLTAACNRHHSSDQQMCRWLLLSLDHLQVNKLVTTKAQIANMIDARREHVTDLAHRRHKGVAFRRARGHAELLDRALLGQRTCECYAVIKKEYGRLLPHTQAT
jgi:CRP-like cAMP-binding protein